MSARDLSATLGWTPLGGVSRLPHGSTVVSDPVPTRQWSVSSPVSAAQSFQQSQVGTTLATINCRTTTDGAILGTYLPDDGSTITIADSDKSLASAGSYLYAYELIGANGARVQL